MKKKFQAILAILEKEKIESEKDLLYFKKKYKDIFCIFLEEFKKMNIEKKRENGKILEELRSKINFYYKLFEIKIKNSKKYKNKDFDYTLPVNIDFGHQHPLSKIKQHIIDFFYKLGFQFVDSNEIEDDWHNFTALNIPYDHPARDMQDTFFLDKDKNWLLRTHTSSSQIRILSERHLPIRCFSIGKVYRNETISARSNNFFHQIECFCVDEKVSFVDFKYILNAFLEHLFGEKIKINMRSSFFPFTSPSVEVDIECLICKGSGCHICKKTGWLEILGGGLIYENVLENCNIDINKYSGYAFGCGLERISLLLYGINDLRLFSENDIRFLKQFI